jgi:DNA-binding LytR/AlgR family response regulator
LTANGSKRAANGSKCAANGILSLPDHGPVMRIHRQLFINIEQVRHYDKDLRITLHPISDYCFKVGRTFRKAFLRALGAS